MRVLVLGSGAREHAIVHALRRSPGVGHIFAAPGNPGIAQAADVLPLSADDLPALAEAASDLKVDLTVVGPELPLALGIADEFAQRRLRLFGPRRAAAELESSKVFSKAFCQRHGIPTARAHIVTTVDEAARAARDLGLPCVFKADGLAAGKGVLIIRDDDDLAQAITVFFEDRRFGEAGDRVVVEEMLVGDEVSYMAISDGSTVVPLASAHDYKRVGDGDSGPNTGGMGSHSPALLPKGMGRSILDDIVRPTVAGMAEEGREYRGILYVGLMLTADGPKVLEYNCRLGDPETQSVLLRLDDNFVSVLKAAADGNLPSQPLRWRREAVACVVLAAEGYPASPRKGDVIRGINDALARPGVTVYQAGTRLEGEQLVTSGGRVLSVCGRGSTLAEAVTAAYGGVEMISFEGMHYRTDIAADTLAQMEADRDGR